MPKAKAKTKIEGSDACMCMHTALRKLCDSKITSAVYNLIHVLEVKPEKYDPWRFLGDLVAARLNKGQNPVDALKYAHGELADKFMDMAIEAKRSSNSPPAGATNWLYALWCAMSCFSKSDWEGMAGFLAD